jgi:hypothetical protein
LHGCRRRDEALSAVQEAIRAQNEQELSIETEIAGFKKDAAKETVRRQQGRGCAGCVCFSGPIRIRPTGTWCLVQQQGAMAALGPGGSRDAPAHIQHASLRAHGRLQARSEQLSSLVRKLEGETAYVAK